MKEKIPENNAIISFLVFLFFFSLPVYSDSLWDPDFGGFLNKNFQFKPGDSLLVTIDSDFKFTLKSTNKDNKLLNLEFTGGGFGDLFSFLPSIKGSGSGSYDSKEEIVLSTELPVQLVSIDDNRVAQIQGQRVISVDGREESISLSGSVSLKDIAKDQSISIHRVNNARLSYSSLLYPSLESISDADLKQIAQEVFSGSETDSSSSSESIGDVELPGNGEEEIGEQPTSTALVSENNKDLSGTNPESVKISYKISDEKQRELFLRYVNRIVDIIFSKPQN